MDIWPRAVLRGAESYSRTIKYAPSFRPHAPNPEPKSKRLETSLVFNLLNSLNYKIKM
jgi:hypothetical protein